MIQYPLRHLVIKPTLACTANCKTCANRRELHQNLRQQRPLSLEQWKDVLSDAKQLGVKVFTISGGEPTLYMYLLDLVRIGRAYGWRTQLNSNGSLINSQLARDLIEAGLSRVSISLYSAEPQIHDELRCSPGLWNKAVSAVKIFSDLKKRYKRFKVGTQTLICRENYKGFAELLELHYNLGSENAYVAYLEGDFEKRYLLNRDEVGYIRSSAIPRAIKFFEKERVDNAHQLNRIFSERIATLPDWERGVYWSRARGCPTAGSFAMILANGDVLPCNIVEYTHTPILGNVFENSLFDIWQSEKTQDYREKRHEKCELCPMNLHRGINLKRTGRLQFAAQRAARRMLGKILVDKAK